MMFLTFLIGFVVAGIIKAVSATAEYYEFVFDHRESLKILKKRKSRHLEALKQIEKSITKIKTKGVVPDSEYFTGVSYGASEYNLLDYLNEPNRGSSRYNILDYYYSDVDEKLNEEEKEK